MMSNNIYQHPAVNWEKARDAYEQTERKEGELWSAWIELGRLLNILRASFPANQHFGAACVEHDIDLKRQQRSAVMWLANLEQSQFDTLRDCFPHAGVPWTLQNNCRERFPQWLTSTRGVVHSVDNADECPDKAEIEQKPAENQGETSIAPALENEKTEGGMTEDTPEDQQETAPAQESCPQIPRMDSRSILYRFLGEDVAKAIYCQWQEENARKCFNSLVQVKKGGKKLVSRIASMIPTHCRNKTNTCSYSAFSHRLFIPDLPSQWAARYGCEWTNVKAIKVILDEIDDAWAMFDAIGPNRPISEYTDWWETRNKHAPVSKSGPDVSAFAKPMEFKPRIRAADTGDENGIRAYGIDIWPADNPSYTHDEAWAAYSFWKTEDQIIAMAHGFENPSSRGRHFMSQCDYLNRMPSGWVAAFRKIALAQFQNPEWADDCHAPPQHYNTV